MATAGSASSDDVGAETRPNLAREQSKAEELANAASHGLGLVLSLAFIPMLMARAFERGNSLQTVGAAVFGASVVLLYLGSTLYHAWPRGGRSGCFAWSSTAPSTA